MKEFAYIMALENYAEDHDLYQKNQVKAIYTGKEEIYTDIINYENKDTVEFTRMINIIDAGDIVKITKISVLGPNIINIVEKYKLLYDKGVKLYICDIGNVMDNAIDSSLWINMLKSIDDDRLYFNRCIGLSKSIKNRPEYDVCPPGKPKKYSNKQLKEALDLLDKFTFKEISNMTGISERTLYRANQKFEEQ